jgi:hypothetical protein
MFLCLCLLVRRYNYSIVTSINAMQYTWPYTCTYIHTYIHSFIRTYVHVHTDAILIVTYFTLLPIATLHIPLQVSLIAPRLEGTDLF